MSDRVSIVVPVFEEEACIADTHRQIADAAREDNFDFELIFVDDGSRDNSPEIIEGLVTHDPRVRAILLQRNFGQTAALAAGIDHARYPVIVTMDADLQNDPKDIRPLLDKLYEGYDVVSGWRKQRQDKLLSRRIPSMIANAIIGRTTGVRLHDYGCALKAYKADVIRKIRLYGELHRFVPALCATVGARIAEMPVRHHARKTGHSKYGIGRTVRVILDLFTVKFLLTHATRPMHFFGTTALLAFLGSVLSGLTTIWMKLGPEHLSMVRNPLLYLTVLLIVIGMQLLSIGLLAELVMRTWFESQSKPVYVIRKIAQLDESEDAGTKTTHQLASLSSPSPH